MQKKTKEKKKGKFLLTNGEQIFGGRKSDFGILEIFRLFFLRFPNNSADDYTTIDVIDYSFYDFVLRSHNKKP